MATPKFWGNLIRELREERGMSQRALSRVTGIDRSTLRTVEEGRPSYTAITHIDALLEFFGYELEAIKREDS